MNGYVSVKIIHHFKTVSKNKILIDLDEQVYLCQNYSPQITVSKNV